MKAPIRPSRPRRTRLGRTRHTHSDFNCSGRGQRFSSPPIAAASASRRLPPRAFLWPKIAPPASGRSPWSSPIHSDTTDRGSDPFAELRSVCVCVCVCVCVHIYIYGIRATPNPPPSLHPPSVCTWRYCARVSGVSQGVTLSMLSVLDHPAQAVFCNLPLTQEVEGGNSRARHRRAVEMPPCNAQVEDKLVGCGPAPGCSGGGGLRRAARAAAWLHDAAGASRRRASLRPKPLSRRPRCSGWASIAGSSRPCSSLHPPPFRNSVS